MSHLSQLKIFVVDDEILYLNIFEQYIRNLGYDNINTFENGNDCLNNLINKPDVVFMDYNMGNLSGYDVLKKIKRIDPNLFVVMISGQEEIKNAIDTLKHGAFDYIQKEDDVENRIKDVLQRVTIIKDSLERSKPSFIKKIFQFL